MAERMELDEVTLAYEQRAIAPGSTTVVFVHGLGGSINSWWAQLAACEERGHPCVAYDQRGAGLSSRPPGPYSVEMWARDLVALLNALEVERPILVGHSVGCMVAEHACVQLGDRIAGLMTIGGALRWRDEAAPVFEERVKQARAGRMDDIATTVAGTGLSEARRLSDPVLLGLFRDLIASNEPQAYAECSAATAVGRMIDMDRVACPVLASCGEHDPVTPPAFAEAIAAAVPDGRTAVVTGAAHWCHLEAPERLNEIMLGFADELAT
jgi:pimeloyl-ACP methyl ester carboxylesterase